MTNNYDLSYLKQPKCNPSLPLLVKSFKYDKWQPKLISESLILYKLLYIKKMQNFEMIVQLHFMKLANMCCSNRSSGIYPLKEGHMR